MRYLFTSSICFLSLALAACGGGSGAAPGAGAPAGALVTGSVLEVDGNTAALGGVRLRMSATGETATSAADGRFAYGARPTGAFTLSLLGAAPARSRHDGPSGAGDDGSESTESEVEIHRVEDGERIHVRLRIRDGRLEHVEVSRSAHDEREVEIRMTRAPTSDDPDVEGELELEVRDDRERLEVEVEHATPGRDLALFLIAPNDDEASLGALRVDAFGEAEWEIDTQEGGLLPFGAGSVADLEGYRAEVRDAGSGRVLLVGFVPEVPAAVPGGESGEGGGEGRQRGRARLRAEVAGLEGYVEVRSRPAEGRERFKVEGERLFAFAMVEFFVEDAVGSGIFVSAGVRLVDLEGEAELELDTGDGASLPNGVRFAADLVGLGVEVRDVATGALLLRGVVPDLVSDD